MPRSFLVKRRKSADAKSVFDSDLSKDSQDCLSHTVEQQKLVPPNQCIEFHQQILHCNTLERNNTWSHPSMPCFPCRARTFPHMPDSCVKFTARNKCVNTHCSTYASMSLPTPLERLDFCTREVENRTNSVTFGTRLEGNLKVARKEEPLLTDTAARDDKLETNDELPTKKMKMETDGKVHATENEHGKEPPFPQNETQLNAVVERTDISKANDELPQMENVKQEFPEPHNLQTNSSELSNGEQNSHEKDDSELTSHENDDQLKDQLISYEKSDVDIQEDVPSQGKRRSQPAKSKKGLKDNNIKPYNTRVITSRPRTYSSDFVIPEEEEDLRQSDNEGYQMKGRQRTKLNRMLANEHERRRVAQLNSAYQDLRQLIPDTNVTPSCQR
ncbi:hypothetical protein OS493_005037 [Desmophyllum pertusum]|uniref:BHLH domain-containing protein n=1 Tax=Desmophyllum pertusum TaxID=174260 RepID=A0A9W9Z4C5_9CNID|nr:hypothetical protein OS493_005037 [Desmophyllum pertusum]